MPEPDRIVRLKTVLNRSGLSRSTVYRKINEGTFSLIVPVLLVATGSFPTAHSLPHESDLPLRSL